MSALDQVNVMDRGFYEVDQASQNDLLSSLGEFNYKCNNFDKQNVLNVLNVVNVVNVVKDIHEMNEANEINEINETLSVMLYEDLCDSKSAPMALKKLKADFEEVQNSKQRQQEIISVISNAVIFQLISMVLYDDDNRMAAVQVLCQFNDAYRVWNIENYHDPFIFCTIYDLYMKTYDERLKPCVQKCLNWGPHDKMPEIILDSSTTATTKILQSLRAIEQLEDEQTKLKYSQDVSQFVQVILQYPSLTKLVGGYRSEVEVCTLRLLQSSDQDVIANGIQLLARCIEAEMHVSFSANFTKEVASILMYQYIASLGLSTVSSGRISSLIVSCIEQVVKKFTRNSSMKRKLSAISTSNESNDVNSRKRYKRTA